MTNDEAQEILIDMRLEEDFPGIYTYSDRQNTAFWMACRALEICKKHGYADYQDFKERADNDER